MRLVTLRTRRLLESAKSKLLAGPWAMPSGALIWAVVAAVVGCACLNLPSDTEQLRSLLERRNEAISRGDMELRGKSQNVCVHALVPSEF